MSDCQQNDKDLKMSHFDSAAAFPLCLWSQLCQVTTNYSRQVNVVEWRHRVAENGNTKAP